MKNLIIIISLVLTGCANMKYTGTNDPNIQFWHTPATQQLKTPREIYFRNKIEYNPITICVA
jgi:hypothetical protein